MNIKKKKKKKKKKYKRIIAFIINLFNLEFYLITNRKIRTL